MKSKYNILVYLILLFSTINIPSFTTQAQDGKSIIFAYVKFKKNNDAFNYKDKLASADSLDLPFIPFRNPLGDEYQLTSKFGKRKHPILGVVKDHNGLDLATKEGNKVYASGAGIIEEVGDDQYLGKYIIVNHLNSFKTIYGHLKNYKVTKGEVVNASEHIGFIGQTGRCTGPHLHFSVKYKEKYIDPVELRIEAIGGF